MLKRVFLEWKEKDGDPAGGTYDESKVPSVLMTLAKRGIREVWVGDKKIRL